MAGMALGEEVEELGARQLTPTDFAALAIDPVQLHHVLGRVHRIRRSIHLGASVFKWFAQTSTLALDAVRREAPLGARAPRPPRSERTEGVHTISHHEGGCDAARKRR
jgi:hypothetical protein